MTFRLVFLICCGWLVGCAVPVRHELAPKVSSFPIEFCNFGKSLKISDEFVLSSAMLLNNDTYSCEFFSKANQKITAFLVASENAAAIGCKDKSACARRSVMGILGIDHDQSGVIKTIANHSYYCQSIDNIYSDKVLYISEVCALYVDGKRVSLGVNVPRGAYYNGLIAHIFTDIDLSICGFAECHSSRLPAEQKGQIR